MILCIHLELTVNLRGSILMNVYQQIFPVPFRRVAPQNISHPILVIDPCNLKEVGSFLVKCKSFGLLHSNQYVRFLGASWQESFVFHLVVLRCH